MLSIFGSPKRLCDGMTRRDMLTIGALGVGGLGLPDILRAEAARGIGNSKKAVIMIYMLWPAAAPGHVRPEDGLRRPRSAASSNRSTRMCREFKSASICRDWPASWTSWCRCGRYTDRRMAAMTRLSATPVALSSSSRRVVGRRWERCCRGCRAARRRVYRRLSACRQMLAILPTVLRVLPGFSGAAHGGFPAQRRRPSRPAVERHFRRAFGGTTPVVGEASTGCVARWTTAGRWKRYWTPSRVEL
jgi:hypothetical protein